ncbi:MAG: hypothetical protein J6Q48_04870 [Bacteroidaceae bacterium]|nr:hypothetical protein [Bacteroidaceae bacterium]
MRSSRSDIGNRHLLMIVFSTRVGILSKAFAKYIAYISGDMAGGLSPAAVALFHIVS